MPTRTPADLWRDLAAEAGEDAIARAVETSPAQAERELRAASFDVAREGAKAEGLLQTLAQGEADHAVDPTARVTKAEPIVRRSPRALQTRWPLLLAAALAAAATGGILYALGHRSKPIDRPAEIPREEPRK